MALCGFNEMMFAGFREFASGVLAQLKKRAQEQGGSLKQALGKELVEIVAFEAMLEGRAKNVTALSGVTQIVRALFAAANEGNSDEEIIELFWHTVNREIEFYRAIDDEFYSKLIPKLGAEEAVERLGDWIDHHRK